MSGIMTVIWFTWCASVTVLMEIVRKNLDKFPKWMRKKGYDRHYRLTLAGYASLYVFFVAVLMVCYEAAKLWK